MIPQFDFSEALHLLKQGKRVARVGWNGKNMWLALTPESTIFPHDARSGAAKMKAITEPEDRIVIRAHIDMRAADGTIVIGWLASQTDMLANDWVEVV